MKADDRTLIERLDDYEERINEWMEAYKPYTNTLNLKELSKLTYKEIKNKLRHHYTDDGKRVKISTGNKIYDLYMYYDDPETYHFDLMNLIWGLTYDIQHPDTFYNFKFASGEISRMSAIHFTYNMILWMPFFALGIRITPDLLFRPKIFSNNTLVPYLNTKLIEPYKHLTTINQMSKLLSRVYDFLILVAEKTAIHLGLSFSLYDLIKRWDSNDELKEINHTEIDNNMMLSEGEAMLDKKAKRFQEIMMTEESDSQLRPLLESGQVNSKQLREFAVNIGNKPDLNGKTINTHPKSNFITKGLRDPVDYVTDASGGRKANVLSLAIDTSGYLQRTICKSASNITLHKDPNYDCGSTHYFVKTINSKKELEDMRGRWYVTEENTLRQLIDTDYDMIGKTLKFRSPTTCASKNGICATCYGHLYAQNRDINVGINSGLKITEHYYQKIMSAKHILNLLRSLKGKLLRV